MRNFLGGLAIFWLFCIAFVGAFTTCDWVFDTVIPAVIEMNPCRVCPDTADAGDGEEK